MKGYLKTYRIEGQEGYDPKTFINTIKPKVLNLINGQEKPAKVKFIMTCEFVKEVHNFDTLDEINTDYTTTYGYFNSTGDNVVTASTDFSKFFNTKTEHLLYLIDNLEKKGSGWIFNKVIYFDIFIDPYKPLTGNSYIPLPSELALKKAIINVKNEKDHECFKWAVTSAVFPKEKDPQRLNKQMRDDSEKLDWTDIEFPVSLGHVKTFEKHNPYAINVYGYEGSLYPLRISEKHEAPVINLLLISNGEMSHYCWIKNMSRLLSSQINNHHHTRMFCSRCLNSFQNQTSLDKHQEWCSRHEAVNIKMPDDKDAHLVFKNFNRKMRVPFVVYADFECFTENISSCSPDESKSFTKQYQRHKPSGFCYLIKCFDDRIFPAKLVHYTSQKSDEDIPQKFVASLEADIREIYDKFKVPRKIQMTTKDEVNYQKAKTCHICNKAITQKRIVHCGQAVHSSCGKQDTNTKDVNWKEFYNTETCHICNQSFDEVKVKDHCHLTGRYRGAAHNKCNLNYQVPKFFPVIFHNLSGYDAHLFIKNLGVSEGKIKCIPNNEEKYISFTKEIVVDTYKNKIGREVKITRDIRFIDSFKFMATSLDSLVSNLPKDSFENLTNNYEGEKLQLLLRKGVFPYDWFDSFSRLSSTGLPPKEMFYSKLNDSDISDEDYTHAKKVWETFEMKTMREYHDLYLKSDVLLLADVFENFRDVCLENYGLDPAWYYTAPGLAWDAALKLTRVELELLTDYDMLLMIETGIRGGVSMISGRYGEANNKYMSSYDPEKPSKFITYLDANNLYGWAMSKPLPTSGFRWMNDGELNDWENCPCILEVDLKYPDNLHDLHNDYPLAPEPVEINKVQKLIPNLRDKTKYIIHHETLKLYIRLGLRVTKIHRGITFREDAWLKPYIDLNTNLRAKATNDFEKDFFKLMNNSVFGKTMENIRNRVDIRLVTNEKDAKKLISKPNYQHRNIFCDNLVAIHMKKTKLVFNKPVYLGMSILDLSKTLMYKFHYKYIKSKYGERAKLLFTDTDSLCYEIATPDFYKDISQDIKSMFDTSNYPKDHPSGIETGVNKKVIGMFKDEVCGGQITEFVGLRAKLYAYKMDSGGQEKKCKGVKKGVVKKCISFDDYKKCLFSQETQMRQMNVIRSHNHEIYTETVNKVALSYLDDKRIIKNDGIHTYAYGHYKVP